MSGWVSEKIGAVGGRAGVRGASVLLALGDAWDTFRIAAFLASEYGLVGDLSPLKSERDQNYHLRTPEGDQRIFKLAHAAEDPAITDFQTQALLHLERIAPALPVPRLVPTLAGELQPSASGPDGRVRRARVLTYLPGTALGAHRPTAMQAARLGALAAQLDIALSRFEHRASRHEFLWDIQHAARTRELLVHTPAADRVLCERTLDRFEQHASRVTAGARVQVIHNDLNPHNVLADAEAEGLSGIIDFGDMVHAPLINEVAVAAAYLLAADDTPLGRVPEFLAAYHAINALRPDEIDVLPELIATRHAITIAITNWRAAIYPENRDYILRNQRSAVCGLNKLALLSADAVRRQFRDACVSS